VEGIRQGFSQRADEYIKRLIAEETRSKMPAPANLEAQKQSRLDAMARAVKLVQEAYH